MGRLYDGNKRRIYLQNFRVNLDIEHINALGVELEGKASSAPTIWSYIDSNNELPYIQQAN